MKKSPLQKQRAFARFKETLSKLSKPQERIQVFRTFSKSDLSYSFTFIGEESVVRFVNMRFLLGGSMMAYGFYFLLIGR